MPRLPVGGDAQLGAPVGRRARFARRTVGEQALAGEHRSPETVGQRTHLPRRGVAPGQLEHEQGEQRAVYDEAPAGPHALPVGEGR